MSGPVRVGVVTIASGRHEHLAAQHASLAAGSRRPDTWVLVAMDDSELATWPERDGLRPAVHPVAREPHGLPLARARNTGVAAALDVGCDVVVCLDVDCLAGPDLVAAYADVVGRRPGTVWSGPVTYLDPPGPAGYPLDRLPALDAPHPARPAPAPGEEVDGANPDLFWSLSFGFSAEAWTAAGGFDEAYVGYGGEDTDFGRRLGAAGVGLGWVGAARAYHQWHPVSDPPVEHLDDILRNAALFHDRWGGWPMGGWLSEFERLGLVEQRAGRWVRTAERVSAGRSAG
ncbi:glycosyltransferase family 2 protein [Nocardioides pantholopis]|uniref:glycosyltransferase family 2 protein n=1 Tax=Nocardioides pantholopis TaxID=2483798 RepID=UPI000F0778B4|nr:galactosyltransferase-related protein [Nocardioides pantholopis]